MGSRLGQRLQWIFYWHGLRRHNAMWFACGTWITSVECYDCHMRWEDDDGIKKMPLVSF